MGEGIPPSFPPPGDDCNFCLPGFTPRYIEVTIDSHPNPWINGSFTLEQRPAPCQWDVDLPDEGGGPWSILVARLAASVSFQLGGFIWFCNFPIFTDCVEVARTVCGLGFVTIEELW